jgi:glycosyltransferase domain-containing protein
LGKLTALLPTRNRPLQITQQLKFLHENHFPHRMIVLDASEPVNAERVRAGCANIAEYRHFSPEYRMADKLAATVGDVSTPYVVLIPDDDIILPQSVADGIFFLDNHADFIAAHGYFVDFEVHDNKIEFSRVVGFTPSIINDEPLRRLYNLFRRYQSFYWGVFRTPVFSSAVTAASRMNVVLFRELTAMSTAILQGKVERMQSVYALHGSTKSHAAIYLSHPFHFFLRDAAGFFQSYLALRNGIAAFIRSNGLRVPPNPKLEQLLDLIYASYLGREIDAGTINRAVEEWLDGGMSAIEPEYRSAAWKELRPGDIAHPATKCDRCYVWRQNVVEAEPRDEISITPSDMARVEKQLNSFELAAAAVV